MTQGALTAIDPRPGWSWEPLGYLAPRVAEDGHGDLEPLSVYLGAGVVRRADREDNHNVLGADMDKYLRVLPGDLVFNKLRTWQGGLGASKYEGIVSPAYYILRPGPRLEPRFAHYLLVSTPYLAELTRLSKFMPPSQFDMPWEELKRLPIALPPVDEQRRIADFLDDQVARIDSLVNARSQQVAALHEQHLSDIYAEMSGSRDSRARRSVVSEWLRDLPADWSFTTVGRLYDIQLGQMLNNERAAGPDQAPYLRNANVTWYRVSLSDLSSMSFSEQARMKFRVMPGDLLVCEGGAGMAEAAVVQDLPDEMFYSKALHRVRATGSAPVEWLMYWLRLAKETGIFEAQGGATTIPHLPADQLRQYLIPVPTDARQRCLRLDGTRIEIEAAAGAIADSVVLLDERKRSLITAAVTGEMDVTTARPIRMGKWVPNVGADVKAPAAARVLSGVGGT